ncbi:hypothetical protein DM860_008804 [Cuscuta australis]|uniref:MORF/ORRM1/DAG-like MORF domain-containing protein n=1 Tax=Cuscuta australis TaxID=267555 RepID=A0A328D6C7_9ASTE|nr:hypothetical protein DM860_008804 [Cuscuta australis]
MHMQQQVPPPPALGVSGTPSLITGLNNGVTEERNCEMEEAETGEQPTIYFRLCVWNSTGTDPLTKACKWFAIPPRGVNVDTNAPLSPAFHEPPWGKHGIAYEPVGVGSHIFLISGVEYTCCDVPIRRVHYLNTQSEEKKWEDGPTLEKAPNTCYIFAVDGKIYALGMYWDNLFTLHYLDSHKLEKGWTCLLELDDYDKSPTSSCVFAHTIEYEAVTDSTTSQPMRCAQRAIIVTCDRTIFYDFKRNEIDVHYNEFDEFGLSKSGVCHNGLMYLLYARYSPFEDNHTEVACFDIEKGKWCRSVKGFEEYDNALPLLHSPDTYMFNIPSLFLHLGEDRFCLLWAGGGPKVHCTRFTLNVRGRRVFAEKVSTQVYRVEGLVRCFTGEFQALAISASVPRHYPAVSGSVAGLETRQISSFINNPSPNRSNRTSYQTRLDGCDYEHWLVVMEKPADSPSRDEIIEGYIKTLAQVVGSEEEARMRIYSVSTRHYYAFGALVSKELAEDLYDLEGVKLVLPDSYMDIINKDYGGEPFINGQAVPYDPKYHEVFVRNQEAARLRRERREAPYQRSQECMRKRGTETLNQ